jgi:predicted CXXCH cytochrome family protein
MKTQFTLHKKVWITFAQVFVVCLVLGVAISMVQPATAAPSPIPSYQDGVEGGEYAGSDSCAGCHKEIHETWSGTLHSQAFSSPVFQEDWVNQGSSASCLECHTTGYDPATGKFAEESVACESCHGPLQKTHPQVPMPITPDYTLCARCHKTTTDEWQASKHGAVKINCEACHNPHSQAPRAESVNELCTNCHKDTGSSFTHGTHANSGLQCSDCHMAAVSHVDATGGLFATGHTFSVGSEACVNCHKDTVHTRDTILKVSGQTAGTMPSAEELEKTVHAQEQQIQSLEAQSSVRLYTGLIQGAIVGLTMGGVAAWVVSRRIQIVEVEEDGKEDK